MSRKDTDGLDGVEREDNVYTFGEYIRKLRKEHGYTLNEGAKRMGFPAQKLCDIESGRRFHKRISIELVQRASEAYGIPVAELFSKVQATIQVKQSTEQILTELVPLVRFAEMEAEKLRNACATYPVELEELSRDVHMNLKKIQVLTRLIHNRTIELKEEK